jgi:hypothetical protein
MKNLLCALSEDCLCLLKCFFLNLICAEISLTYTIGNLKMADVF